MKKIISLILFTAVLLGSIGVVSASGSNVVCERIDFNDMTAITWPTDTSSPSYASQVAAAKNLTTLLPAKGINLSHYNPDWLSDPMHYNIVDSGSARGKYLELIKQNTTDTSSVAITIPVNYTKNNDILVFEYDFKATGLAGLNYTALNVHGKDSSNADAILLNTYMTGNGFGFDPSGTYSPDYVPGTWYSAKITLDLYTGAWTFSMQAEGTENVLGTNAYFPAVASAADKSMIQSVSYLELRLGHLCTAYGASTASLAVDNVKAYTVDKNFALTGTSITETTDVSVSQEVSYSFNSFVSPSSLKDVVVKAGESTLTAGTDYSLSVVENASKLGSTVKVNFPNGKMAYGTTYTITFPTTVTDQAGQGLAAEVPYSFTTEALPTFTMSDVSAKFGWSGSGNAITSLAQAGGQMIQVTATATNTTGKAVSAIVIVAVYDNGTLVNCSAIAKDFDIGGTEVINCAIKLPADASNCELKAFVCSGLNNMTALGTPVVIGQ